MEKVKCDGCGQTYWLTSKSKWQHRECVKRVSAVQVENLAVPAKVGVVRGPEPGELESKPRKQRWDVDKYRAYMKMHMAVKRAVEAGRAMWVNSETLK